MGSRPADAARRTRPWAAPPRAARPPPPAAARPRVRYSVGMSLPPDRPHRRPSGEAPPMSARLIGRAAGVIHCYHKRRPAGTPAPVSCTRRRRVRADRRRHRRHLHGHRRARRRGPPRPDQGALHAQGPARGHRRRGAPGARAWPAAASGGVERFIHGTTVATNAVLEQKGAVTAVLTTEGFEDVLEIGRQKRSRMYDLDMDPETPDLPRPAAPPLGHPRADRRARRACSCRSTRRRSGPAVGRAAGRGRRRPSPSATSSRSSTPRTSGGRARSSGRSRPAQPCRSPARSTRPSASTSGCCVTAFDAYLGPVMARYLGGPQRDARGGSA